VRVALVGCGRISQVAHLPAMAKVENLELVAAVDTSRAVADGVAARWSTSPYTDLDRCIRDLRPDAAIVTAPDRAHASIAQRLLAAGCHVLIEKPMTATVSEAEAVVRAVAESGCVLQVGTMKRHDPGLMFARSAVVERLGEVLSFSAWYRTTSMREVLSVFFPPLVSDPAVAAIETGFKADRESYFLATHGSHLWDLIRYVIGDVRRLRALRARVGADISWQAVVELAGGAVGSVDLTIDQHGEGSEGLSIRCEKGSVEVRTYTPFARRASEVRLYEDSTRTVSEPVFAYANQYEWQLRAFAGSLADASTMPANTSVWGTPADAADGLAVVRLLDAVARSVESGSEVDLGVTLAAEVAANVGFRGDLDA
jgi:predicted dehydrogenase